MATILMTVRRDTSIIRHEHGGKAFYFCSDACLVKFREDRVRFSIVRPEQESPGETGTA